MTNRVDGKMSFVTGAAQGLGEAIAYMLAKEGSKVVLADINYDKVLEILRFDGHNTKRLSDALKELIIS